MTSQAAIIPNLELLDFPSRLSQTVQSSFDKLFHSKETPNYLTSEASKQIGEKARKVGEELVGKINGLDSTDTKRRALFSMGLQHEIRRICLECTHTRRRPKGFLEVDLFAEPGTIRGFNQLVDQHGVKIPLIVSKINQRFKININSNDVRKETTYNELIDLVESKLPRETK